MGVLKLDWTNAHKGRLQGAEEQSVPISAQDTNQRFTREIQDGKLPFINMPYQMEMMEDLKKHQKYLTQFKHMVLLGIGGSALGARALQKAFFPEQDQPNHAGPSLWIADNIDVITVQAWFKKLPPEQTVVVVVSKSGTTIETISQYILVRKWLADALGEDWKKNVFVVTDKNKGFLREEVENNDLPSMPVPDNLGGRYSVLSAVGLIPAVFLGLDVQELVRGAVDAAEAFQKALENDKIEEHPVWKTASWNYTLIKNGYSQLIFFSYIPLWGLFGDWFSQLWAESLGKEGKGSMPLPAVGVTDQHSLQQMFLDGPKDKGCLLLTCSSLPKGPEFSSDLPPNFTYLQGKSFGEILDAEALGTKMALTENSVPLLEIQCSDDSLHSAGKMIEFFELTTLLTGWMLKLNPLDQPAVELGKRLAKAELGAEGFEEEKAALQNFKAAETLMQEL